MMSSARKGAVAAALAAFFPAGAAWANFGFAPDPGETCLVALEQGADGPFYWTTGELVSGKGAASWRRVWRDPDYRAKYEKQYYDRVDVLKPSGHAAEPLTTLPRGLEAREESCLATWTRYWRLLTRTAPEADPARAVDFSFDPGAVAKGVFNVEDVGTGFFISKQGLFITNYHVAKFLCDVPKTGSRDSAIPCKAGYTLLSFTDWTDYVAGHDYALLVAPQVKRDVRPLAFRAELPKRWERVFLAGFPTQAFTPEFFKAFSKTKVYPSRNSGKTGPFGFLKWDPLVLSTGRLSVSMEVTHLFPGAPRKILLGSGHDPFDRDRVPFSLQEWDQDLESSPQEVPSGPGSSGSPLMDAAGRVVGVLHRDNMYYSTLLMVEALDLCNRTGSRNPARQGLAEELSNQGLCPVPPPASQAAVSRAQDEAVGRRVSGVVRRLEYLQALPATLFDGRWAAASGRVLSRRESAPPGVPGPRPEAP